jgi:hypothetical protein
MQHAVDAFVAASDRPEEVTPLTSRLSPRRQIIGSGVLKHPILSHNFAAMQGKTVWKALRCS